MTEDSEKPYSIRKGQKTLSEDISKYFLNLGRNHAKQTTQNNASRISDLGGNYADSHRFLGRSSWLVPSPRFNLLSRCRSSR